MPVQCDFTLIYQARNQAVVHNICLGSFIYFYSSLELTSSAFMGFRLDCQKLESIFFMYWQNRA